jgi:DNA-binding LytR/AlgR family response regulator
MRCIIIDDEPLAREAIELMVDKTIDLKLLGMFRGAVAASAFLEDNPADLIFLDISMPGISGIEFAKTIPKNTLVIFTTAYAGYALEGYETEAVDFLIKPIVFERFKKAVAKAVAYHQLLISGNQANTVKAVENDYIFLKSDRKFVKVYYHEILFIEGLKDYVVVQTDKLRLITAMNIKTISSKLPQDIFMRVSKSYLINVNHIDSFDNSTIYIASYEVPLGNAYRHFFFEEFAGKKLLGKGNSGE